MAASPLSFRPITPRTEALADLKVGDLIDHDSCSWRMDMIHQVFLACRGVKKYPNRKPNIRFKNSGI